MAKKFTQQEVEKLIAYLFLTFILLVACFNIIGSVSMLIIDKKDDVRTLRNLGAKDNHLPPVYIILSSKELSILKLEAIHIKV